MTKDEFVAKYVNKRNQATGMYWRIEDAAKDAGIPVELAESFLCQAQQANLASVYGAMGIGASSGWTAQIFRYDQQQWYQKLLKMGLDPMTGEKLEQKEGS